MELSALGRKPHHALYQSVEASAPCCYTILVDGTPAGLFGAAPDHTTTDPEAGVPWLLGTPDLLKARRELITQARLWVSHLRAVYPKLSNYVDERNTVSINWLKRMGFLFDEEPVPVGPTHFRRFHV